MYYSDYVEEHRTVSKNGCHKWKYIFWLCMSLFMACLIIHLFWVLIHVWQNWKMNRDFLFSNTAHIWTKGPRYKMVYHSIHSEWSLEKKMRRCQKSLCKTQSPSHCISNTAATTFLKEGIMLHSNEGCNFWPPTRKRQRKHPLNL